MNDSALTIFTMVWGEKHLRWLKDFSLPSLLWPENLPATEAFVHIVACTVPGQRAPVREIFWPICTAADPPFSSTLQVIEVDTPVSSRQFSLNCLIEGIRASRRNDTRLLIAPPDTVFGNGSIGNMFEYAKGKPVTVAAAHLRVDAPKFHTFTGGTLDHKTYSNAELVDVAWQTRHQSYADSFNPKNANGCHDGGISITPLMGGINTMIHHLPTSYLCAFTEDDERWFEQQLDMGSLDHLWPSRLIEQRRYRLLGSTDLFFAVELTEPDSNRVAVAAARELCESYKFDELHHRMNEMFVIGMRGDG